MWDEVPMVFSMLACFYCHLQIDKPGSWLVALGLAAYGVLHLHHEPGPVHCSRACVLTARPEPGLVWAGVHVHGGYTTAFQLHFALMVVNSIYFLRRATRHFARPSPPRHKAYAADPIPPAPLSRLLILVALCSPEPCHRTCSLDHFIEGILLPGRLQYFRGGEVAHDGRGGPRRDGKLFLPEYSALRLMARLDLIWLLVAVASRRHLRPKSFCPSPSQTLRSLSSLPSPLLRCRLAGRLSGPRAVGRRGTA